MRPGEFRPVRAQIRRSTQRVAEGREESKTIRRWRNPVSLGRRGGGRDSVPHLVEDQPDSKAGTEGFEPSTCRLTVGCSAIELRPKGSILEWVEDVSTGHRNAYGGQSMQDVDRVSHRVQNRAKALVGRRSLVSRSTP